MKEERNADYNHLTMPKFQESNYDSQSCESDYMFVQSAIKQGKQIDKLNKFKARRPNFILPTGINPELYAKRLKQNRINIITFFRLLKKPKPLNQLQNQGSDEEDLVDSD